MKIFKGVYYVFIGLIALIAVLLVVSIFPITGNFKVLTVLSGSMEPSIHKGSVVVVKPASDYKIGDVITFGQMGKNKTPITHRINDIRVNVGIPSYITKGDANEDPDIKEVSAKEIAGKVLFNVPYVGYAIETARKPWGFAVIIIIPAIIIIYDEIKKVINEIKKLKKKPGEEKSAK